MSTKTFSIVVLLLSSSVCLSQQLRPVNSTGMPTRSIVGGTTSLVLLNDINALERSPVLFGGTRLTTSQPVTLLGIPEIVEEISLGSEQRIAIDKISKDATSKIEAFLFSAAPESEQADLGLEILDNIKRLRKERDELIASVLRNDQKKRLRQILLQMQIRSLGEVDGLTSEPIASQIGLDMDSSKRIKEFGKKVEAEMKKKIAAIREAARSEIREQLDQEQQSKLFELIGDRIDFEAIRKQNAGNN